MARKVQVSVQDSVETEDEFKLYLRQNSDKLICMEVYSSFCGPCLATQNAIRRGKLEIGEDDIAMVKCQSDNIPALVRFKNKSEPVFLFIYKGKLTRAMFGANAIELIRLIEQELGHLKMEKQGITAFAQHDIEELLPEEAEKIEEARKIEEEHFTAAERLRVLTLAARKKRVAERMVYPLRHLNFIVFWPHCHKAHYELYMKWDAIDISVAAKEEIQFTPELAKEVFYMGDIDPNEACIHALCNGEALVVLFKMFEIDERDFVEVLRYALYTEIPQLKPDVPVDMQPPPIAAFQRYATISKSAREVRRDRYNQHMDMLRLEQEERDRLEAERARLEREAEEDRRRAEKQRKDEERLARIQAGLPAEPEPGEEEVDPTAEGEQVQGEEMQGEEKEKAETEATEVTEVTEVPEGEAITEEQQPTAPGEEPTLMGEGDTLVVGEGDTVMLGETEEKVEEEEVFHSDVEVEDEPYIPPEGLFVPGLYTPPNNLAKVNAILHLFPKVVSKLTAIESEFLPPHLLVMFLVDRRHDIQAVIDTYRDEILNYGIFEGEDPFHAEHLAYTIKQYDKMDRQTRRNRDRLAVAVSRRRSLPLLQLAGFSPTYISSDAAAGERDCLNLFPVGYGDQYIDEPSIQGEEVEVKPAPALAAVEGQTTEVDGEHVDQEAVDEADIELAGEDESSPAVHTTQEVPETEATPTSESPIPEVPAPEALVPEVKVPESAVPEAPTSNAPAPEASLPKTTAPEASVPKAPAPEASIPKTPAPETSVPKVPAPEASLSKTPAPEASVSKTPAADASVPTAPAAEASVPKTPDPEASVADIPAPEASVPKAPGHEATVPKAPGHEATVPKSPAPGTPTPEVPASKSPPPEATAPAGDAPAPETSAELLAPPSGTPE